MMPMLPPSNLEDLAREHLGSHARLHRKKRIHDRDGSFADHDALPPDPLYMALRHAVTRGPIAVISRLANTGAMRKVEGPPAPIASLPDADADADADQPIAA